MTDSMQALESDNNKTREEGMTLTRMTDVISCMTPEQRDCLGVVYEVGVLEGRSAEDIEVSQAITHVLELPIGSLRRSWGRSMMPFKFGTR